MHRLRDLKLEINILIQQHNTYKAIWNVDIRGQALPDLSFALCPYPTVICRKHGKSKQTYVHSQLGPR